MSANLDRICTVDISLATPISNNANFDNSLIIGPLPKAPKATIPGIFVVNGLDELTEMGFVAVGDNADPIGVAARVAFSQSPRPHEVYVTCLPEESGEEDEAGGSVVADTLTAALGTNGWYCIHSVGLTKDQIREVIQWTETQNKLHGYMDDDPENPIVEAGIYLRSFPVYPKVTEAQPDEEVPLENKYGMSIAMAAKAMNFHAGEETWALKQLNAVTPSKLNTTAIKKMEKANFSYVITVASKNITQGGKTNSGEWIDIVRFRDWLQNDMQVRVANLFITNPKIPYTDKGIGLIQNQMIASLKSGVYYEGIAPDEYDEDGNLIPGFTTHVPLSANLTASQKASRKLTDCNFTARLAGAIHFTEIKGTLTYNL